MTTDTKSEKSTEKHSVGGKSGKTVKRKSRSLILYYLNMFTAFIYSLFRRGRIGRFISGNDDFFEESTVGRLLKGGKSDKNRKRPLAAVLENGFAAKRVKKTGYSLLTMSCNVYGLFFLVYGAATVILYYALLFITNKYNNGVSGLLTGISVIICSLPLIMKNSSAAETLRTSRLGRRLVFNYFCIPEENLNLEKKLGGTAYMLVAAFAGLAFGALTYFVHPIYLPLLFVATAVLFTVLASPETGVIITVTFVPFLRYFSISYEILIIMIGITALSYVLKILRGKRTVSFSPAGVMVILYAASIVISGINSEAGYTAFLQSIAGAFIILGSFFMAHNLMRSDKKSDVCLKILLFLVVFISVLDLALLYYSTVSDGLIYSVRNQFKVVLSESTTYVTYGVEIFGLFAAMVSPLLISKCFSQKRIYGVVSTLLCFLTVLCNTFLSGSYENLVALCIGVVLYLILYGHKTLTVVLIIALPAAAFLIMYPYFLNHFGFRPLGEILNKYLPETDSSSPYVGEITSCVLDMIGDGHLGGIGAGDYAFAHVFPRYANAVSASASDPGTLYMQVLCWSGVIGFLIFAAFILFLARSGLGYIKFSSDSREKLRTLALFCGFITALLYGAVSCIWSDTGGFYIFWLIAGMLSGSVSAGYEKEKQKEAYMGKSPKDTDIFLKSLY